MSDIRVDTSKMPATFEATLETKEGKVVTLGSVSLEKESPKGLFNVSGGSPYPKLDKAATYVVRSITDVTFEVTDAEKCQGIAADAHYHFRRI